MTTDKELNELIARVVDRAVDLTNQQFYILACGGVRASGRLPEGVLQRLLAEG